MSCSQHMHPPGTTTLLSAHVRPLDNAPFVCTHVSTDSRVHPHVLAHPPRPMWWTKRWRRAHVLSLPSIPHPQPHHSRSGRADHPLANDDFLFNIIDPLEAAPIRKTQHEWLSQNVDKSRVAAALLEVEPALSAANTTNLDADALAHWPKEQLGRALLGAMLRVFVGAPSANLSEDELRRLQAALHGFRLAPRGSLKMEQPIAQSSGANAQSSGAKGSGLFGAPNEDFVGEVRRSFFFYSPTHPLSPICRTPFPPYVRN